MISLRLLVPEATINYVLNPSFRYDTSGWDTNFSDPGGTAMTRTLDYARFNIASMKVITPGSVAHEGVYYLATGLTSIGDSITASVYLRGEGRVRLRLIEAVAGNEWIKDKIIL